MVAAVVTVVVVVPDFPIPVTSGLAVLAELVLLTVLTGGVVVTAVDTVGVETTGILLATGERGAGVGVKGFFAEEPCWKVGLDDDVAATLATGLLFTRNGLVEALPCMALPG